MCFCSFFKQKTAYEMRISDFSSDVCSSDLTANAGQCQSRIEQCHNPDDQEDIDDERDIRIEAEASICHDHEPKHRDGRNHARQNALADGVSAQVRSYGALLHYRQSESGRASCRERVCQYV